MKGLNRKDKKRAAVSESDLEAFIDLSKQSGIFDHDQDKKIKSLLALDELTAEDIMTPRVKIKALDDDITLDEAIDELTDLHYSRIPVYHETIDSIDRIVTIKELLRFRKKVNGDTLISELKLSPISKIPRSQPIDTLLEKFQKTHKHIAVIVDEY
ncbi:CBS domain-containing protein [bacterium]|nr:CBS domain-containing protein [bacterium]